jgi:alanine-synthesizing transaminase
MPDFYRIKRLPPYVFEQVNRIKAAARANGADIIDLGMGNPDLQAPQHVIDKLVETVGKPRTTAIRPPRASAACAAPRPAITSAASA